MKKAIILILLLTLNFYGFCQNAGFVKSFSGPSNQIYPISIEPTLDSGFIISGHVLTANSNMNLFLIKTDLSGDTVWTKFYDSGGGDYAYSAKQLPDSGYIVCGYVNNGVHSILVFRTNMFGDTLWTKTISSLGYSYFSLTRVIPTSDNGFLLITGYESTFDGEDIAIIKMNANGQMIWSKRYDNQYMADYARDIIETADGNYALVGTKRDPDEGDIGLLLRISHQGGGLLSVMEYYNVPYPLTLKQTPDGGFIILGGYLIKTDSLGTVQWAKYYNNIPASMLHDFDITADNDFLITMGDNPGNVYVLKTDSAGDPLYCKKFFPPASNKKLRADALAVSDNKFSIVGTLNSLSISEGFFTTSDFTANSCYDSLLNVTADTAEIWGDFGWMLFNNSPLTYDTVISVVPTIPLSFSTLCSIPVSLQEESASVNEFNIYPNPSDGNFNISYLLPQKSKGLLTVNDLLGREMFTQQLPFESTMQSISLSHLKNGMYNVTIRSQNSSLSKRLVIVK